MGTNPTTLAAPTTVPSVQPRDSRLIASPVVRTRVLTQARVHLAAATPGELSTLIVRDLRGSWPTLSEDTVDLIIAGECMARSAEADTYRESMKSALSVGYSAAADVREEYAECRPRRSSKPARREVA